MINLDLSKIKVSRNDIKRGLKFPHFLSSKLAEDIGIMLGDGSIGAYKCGNYEVCVSGNIITDRSYLISHTKKLKQGLFNLKFKIKNQEKKNTAVLYAYSVGLVNFYTKVIGLPLGAKTNIGIPKIIMDSHNNLKKATLKGLADTDFSFCFLRKKRKYHCYPKIKLGTSSKRLVLDTTKLLRVWDLIPQYHVI